MAGKTRVPTMTKEYKETTTEEKRGPRQGSEEKGTRGRGNEKQKERGRNKS
jgi:hypothetical protein